jgi:hypothetical protein
MRARIAIAMMAVGLLGACTTTTTPRVVASTKASPAPVVLADLTSSEDIKTAQFRTPTDAWTIDYTVTCDRELPIIFKVLVDTGAVGGLQDPVNVRIAFDGPLTYHDSVPVRSRAGGILLSVFLFADSRSKCLWHVVAKG